MVIIDLTARSTTMTSGRWGADARTDRIFFASTWRIRWISFDTRAHTDFCWVPSGEMESAEQTGRASSKLLARERRAFWRLTRGAFSGILRSL